MSLPVAVEIVEVEIFVVQGYRIEDEYQHDTVIIFYCLFCVMFIFYILLFSLFINKN